MKATVTLLFGIVTTLAAADLSGLVVAEHDGSAVAAVAITLRSGDRVVAEFETDDAGRFRAPGLPAAEYVVVAAKTNFTSAERRVTLIGAGAEVLLQVTKLGSISGRVTDNQGNGVRNMVVAAVPAPSDGGPARVYNTRPKGAATDASGRYRIFGLTAGDYLVLALAGNARSTAEVPNGVVADTSHGSTAAYYPSTRSPAVLSIRSGEQHTNIDLKGYSGPLYTVRGTVSGPGPETAYRVSLVAEGVGLPVGSAAAQPGKEFQFDRVAPGTYKIVAIREPRRGAANIIELVNSGQLTISAANLEAILKEMAAEERAIADNRAPSQKAEPVFAETTVTVAQDLAGVALSARPGVDTKVVYQPADGCPTSVQLTFLPTEFLGTGSLSRRLMVRVESAVTGMPVAAYGVALNLPEGSGCYAVTSTIDFRQGSPEVAVPIVVGKMGQIQGKVDTTGYTPGEFSVVLIEPGGIARRSFALAKDSSFSIPNLRPGRYRVSVTRRSATRVVAADQDIAVEGGASAQLEFPALP